MTEIKKLWTVIDIEYYDQYEVVAVYESEAKAEEISELSLHYILCESNFIPDNISIEKLKVTSWRAEWQQDTNKIVTKSHESGYIWNHNIKMLNSDRSYVTVTPGKITVNSINKQTAINTVKKYAEKFKTS